MGHTPTVVKASKKRVARIRGEVRAPKNRIARKFNRIRHHVPLTHEEWDMLDASRLMSEHERLCAMRRDDSMVSMALLKYFLPAGTA